MTPKNIKKGRVRIGMQFEFFLFCQKFLKYKIKTNKRDNGRARYKIKLGFMM